MTAALLLAITLALPASGEKNHVDVSVAGNATVASFAPDNGPSDGHGAQGEGSVGATIYPRGIVDDDAAPGLQPFLQRAFRLHFGGWGGGGASYAGDGPNAPERDFSFGGADVWLEGYPHRNFYLGARFSVARLAFRDTWPVGSSGGNLSLIPEATAGVRLSDVLLFAGWGVAVSRPDGGTFSAPFLEGVYGGVNAVVARQLEVGASIGGEPGGAHGRAHLLGYGARRIYGWLELAVGHGGDVVVRTHIAASLGVGAWFNRRVGVSFSYAPSVSFGAGRDDTFHLFTLTVFARR